MSKVWGFIKKYFLAITLAVAALVPVAGVHSYQFYIIERGLQNSILVMSLVVLLGYTGLLSLGHAGLLAVGAYAYSILTVHAGFNPWVAFIAAPLIAAALGAILGIPSFRLSGPFLVVTTIAFGEIVRILILNQVDLTGGPYGFLVKVKLFTDATQLYYFIVILVFLVGVAVQRLKNSRIGLAFRAVKKTKSRRKSWRRRKTLQAHRFCTSSFWPAFPALSLRIWSCTSTRLLYLAESSPPSFWDGSRRYVQRGRLALQSLAVTALPEVLRFMEKSRLVIYSLVLIFIIRFFKDLRNWEACLPKSRDQK